MYHTIGFCLYLNVVTVIKDVDIFHTVAQPMSTFISVVQLTSVAF